MNPVDSRRRRSRGSSCETGRLRYWFWMTLFQHIYANNPSLATTTKCGDGVAQSGYRTVTCRQSRGWKRRERDGHIHSLLSRDCYIYPDYKKISAFTAGVGKVFFAVVTSKPDHPRSKVRIYSSITALFYAYSSRGLLFEQQIVLLLNGEL
ncbi:hypothetical protein OE88DRAFT_550235 [Heliocybe sulcata]|uniref:Uncharacterized protein n=1 Tax=Heliocybe sulcata TaxID=5364 RepID=A0A5C3MTL5_9AGAM|nr:hypothetical protein OE88DRAFT_550235 [Heliocybe sulcata]